MAAWLDTMRAAGVKLTIASNNMPGRVAPFAKLVGLEYCLLYTSRLAMCECFRPLVPELVLDTT